MTIVLHVFSTDTQHGYDVTFEGTLQQAETNAVLWVLSHRAHYADLTDEARDDEATAETLPRLVDALYPTCEHGLSEALCQGYGHYGTYEQEKARAGYAA